MVFHVGSYAIIRILCAFSTRIICETCLLTLGIAVLISILCWNVMKPWRSSQIYVLSSRIAWRSNLKMLAQQNASDDASQHLSLKVVTWVILAPTPFPHRAPPSGQHTQPDHIKSFSTYLRRSNFVPSRKPEPAQPSPTENVIEALFGRFSFGKPSPPVWPLFPWNTDELKNPIGQLPVRLCGLLQRHMLHYPIVLYILLHPHRIYMICASAGLQVRRRSWLSWRCCWRNYW